MLTIQRAANGEVVSTLIVRMDVENVAELKGLFASEPKGRHLVMDLKDDLTRVDREAAKFLGGREAGSIKIKNFPGVYSRVDPPESGDRANSASTNTIVVAIPSALTVRKRV
jgi:hypothetical protein